MVRTMTSCLTFVPVYGSPTKKNGAWTGGARSVVEFGGNAWFGWEVLRSAVGVIAGFSNEDTGANYLDITHGFRFERGNYQIIESGQVIQIGPVGVTSPIRYDEGDRFYVSRWNNQVVYSVRAVDTLDSTIYVDSRFPGLALPGPIIYVSEEESFGAVFLDTSLYVRDDTVTNPAGSEFPYYSGADKDPNINDESPDGETKGFISGTIEFELQASAGGAAVIYGDLIFSGSASGSTETGISGNLILTGLASDRALDTRIVGSLPLGGSAQSQGLVSALSGAVGFLYFDTFTNTSDSTVIAVGDLNLGGYAAAANVSIINGELLFLGQTSYSQNDNFIQVVLSIQQSSLPVNKDVEVTENLELRTNLRFNRTNNVVDILNAVATAKTFYNPNTEILEDVLALATQNNTQFSTLTDILNSQDTVTVFSILNIAEQLVASDSVQNLYHGVVQVLSEMLVADSERSSYPFEVAEYLAFSDESVALVNSLVEQLDSVMLSTATDNILTIMVDETAELLAADSIELTTQLFVELLEHADMYTLFKTNDEIAQAWVMNTEARMALSQYDNYTFTSMTTFKGKSFGTTDSGLFELEGDTDVGNPITAQVESMMLDFGTSRMKRIRTAYMGYTSSNDLVLKVMSVDDGELFEHWYKANPVGSNAAPRTGMVEVGQGLRSRYWQFELTNVDGGDFELDVLELYPLFLGRRI